MSCFLLKNTKTWLAVNSKIIDLVRVLAILWLAGIVFLLAMPGENIPRERFIPYQDKVAHFGLFAGYAFLWLRGFVKNDLLSRRVTGIVIVAFGVAVGVITEVYQQYVPDRTGDLLDFLADMSGLIVGMLFYFMTKKRNHSAAN